MGQIDRDRTWAVVPVAGFGTRLQPHTHTRPKSLLHVAGQPILGHILDQMVALGIERIVLVVGYMGEQIIDYVQQRGDFARVESVEQPEPLGLGHAIYLTRSIVGGDPMLIVYGDTIFQADLQALWQAAGDGFLGVKKVGDPERFGVVVEERGQVVKLREKPEEFVSDLAIVGTNLIANSSLLFACLEQLLERDIRTRGEYQLTDALQLMVERGAQLGTFPVENWFDCGTREALLLTNRYLLEQAPVPEGPRDTVIIPPVHLDPAAMVSRSVIGPYVSVGRQAKVDNSIVRNTILGEQAMVEDLLLEDSIVGFQALVRGRAGRVNVGDMSQITA